MHKAFFLFVFPLLLCVGVSPIAADEPALEPIPLPAPKPLQQLARDGEPTPAFRNENSPGPDEPFATATHESDVADEPMILEAIEPASPIQSAPPIILHEPAPIADGSPIEGSPVIQPAPPVTLDAPGRIESPSKGTIELTEPTPLPAVRPIQPHATQQPRQNPNCVCQPRPKPSVPPRQYRVPAPQQYSRLRYDAAVPYVIRQSTEVRPGPGRTATQVTTYEVTRFRPVTYQVRVPDPRTGVYAVAPGYNVLVAPIPEPGIGPVRGWLRRQIR